MTTPLPLPASPAAQRLGAPRWRDGRLLAGIVLLLASVAIGARLLSTGGAKTPVLSAASNLTAGHVLTDADLTTTGVTLAGGAGSYLVAGDRAAVIGKTLTRPVGQGELLPGSAVVNDTASTTAEVSLSVRDGRHPALDAGDRVDVYATTEAPSLRPGTPGSPTPAASPGAGSSTGSGSSTGAAAAGTVNPVTANPAAICTTVTVAVGLEVVTSVPTDADGSAVTVILRVPPAEAAALVHAGEAGDIDLVREPRVVAGTGSTAAPEAAAPAAPAAGEPTAAPLQAIGPVTAGACATGK